LTERAFAHTANDDVFSSMLAPRETQHEPDTINARMVLQVPIPVPLPFFSFTGEPVANSVACWSKTSHKARFARGFFFMLLPEACHHLLAAA